MKYVVALALVLSTGCAARQGYAVAPTVASLIGYVANEKATLWRDGSGCHLVVKFADGQTVSQRLNDVVCVTGAAWVKGVASVPKLEPAK